MSQVICNESQQEADKASKSWLLGVL